MYDLGQDIDPTQDSSNLESAVVSSSATCSEIVSISVHSGLLHYKSMNVTMHFVLVLYVGAAGSL